MSSQRLKHRRLLEAGLVSLAAILMHAEAGPHAACSSLNTCQCRNCIAGILALQHERSRRHQSLSPVSVRLYVVVPDTAEPTPLLAGAGPGCAKAVESTPSASKAKTALFIAADVSSTGTRRPEPSATDHGITTCKAGAIETESRMQVKSIPMFTWCDCYPMLCVRCSAEDSFFVTAGV